MVLRRKQDLKSRRRKQLAADLEGRPVMRPFPLPLSFALLAFVRAAAGAEREQEQARLGPKWGKIKGERRTRSHRRPGGSGVVAVHLYRYFRPIGYSPVLSRAG
jgi:hypothetical protein